MKQFLINAANSWVTTAGGAVIGLPILWEALQPVLDSDPATVANWMEILKGIGIVVLGMFARDWTKGLIEKDKK